MAQSSEEAEAPGPLAWAQVSAPALLSCVALGNQKTTLGLFSFLPYPFVIGDMYLNSGAKRIHSGAQKVKKKKSSVYYSAGCLSLLKAQYINDTQRESPFVTRPKEGNFQARNGGLQVTV